MVTDEKKALTAIHRLLIHGRVLVLEGKTNEELFNYFDELEGLMGYVIAWEGNMSESFEKYLESVCAKANAEHIFVQFKR